MKYYWAIMEKPSRTTKFLRSLETLKEFDGEEGGSSSSDTGSSSSGAIAAPVIRSANSFMMVTLLDVLCSFYTTEPDTNDKLLKVLLKQLATNKIIAPLFEIDELSSVRSQFKRTFCQMIETALATLNQDVNVSNTSSLRKVTSLLLQPHLPRDQLIFSSVSGFYNSRYKDDFLEEELIGHGAYGNVFRVKNKLDGHEYAVKKILFVAWESEFWLHKLLREVTHLANLQHPNIVRYHNAWFEYDSPWMDWMRKRSRQPALLWESDSAKVTESSDVETSELISAAHFCRAVTEWCGPEETDDIVFEASAASAQHACPEMKASGPTANSFYPDIYTELSHIPTRERLSGGDNPLPQQKACVVLHIQMELCEMTLSDWLSDRNSKLSHSDDSTAINKDITSKILKEILKGVDYMHDHNIIHRDLKPMNIFLQITSGCNNMRVKIGDFGLARNTYCDDVSRVPQSPLTPNPTQKGDAPILTEGIGTTTYAAPEQINGTNYNNKCDMYSLGFIMLELYQPFSTVMERSFTLRDLREGRLLESFKTSWPAQATCIGSLTDVDPTRRPSARDVLDGELFSNKDKATCIGSLTDVDPTRRPSARDVLDGELFSNKDKIINDLKNVIKSKDERILELERAMSAMEKKIKNHPPANI